MQLYIGNLSEMTTAYHLACLFLPFGKVSLSKIVQDEKTGRSRCFGFIEMEARGAKVAIQKLDRFRFMNSYMEVKAV